MFDISPSLHEYSALCSKSIRIAGIAIVLIPLLCLDEIGVFDPPASNGEAWKGAERFMSAVVFVVVLAAFCAVLYLLTGDVKWIERNVEVRKGLFVWQDAARKRSREEQERRAREWKRRRMEKMREKQKEEEKKVKEAKKEALRKTREEEKDQRLAEMALKGLKPEELSAAMDEINDHYEREEREEIEAKKRKEEEERANRNSDDDLFKEPSVNSAIHEI
ncbi:uncharacterized protein MONOS_2883 [Monocercomonoides exilis]|uniref:uncharacterized protein n=1 Tax=Monocercomonoides exilis TaxID=2049356 RepID=UPI003559774A|nr:hypothetical protein MONOS_2883 [Monocercomonoides exilis]|eukprot:MONOS_2883.1-p1 / transcript=MONOS_2883.1 / gene=MONOS_2883 / organism=Monocercomonoides_exilis_PA203 / gene_product=unspecified product / transcript_product=unspecified product / location=Mono_scaffold00062:144003-144743(+) / protein_length=220 / sequence_SO=supercontig / SO=protein_coding / is_pseudo=false